MEKLHRILNLSKRLGENHTSILTQIQGKKQKNNCEKKNFKLIYNAVFQRIMQNVRKHRDIKLVKTERRRNYLASELIYDTRNFSHKMC